MYSAAPNQPPPPNYPIHPPHILLPPQLHILRSPHDLGSHAPSLLWLPKALRVGGTISGEHHTTVWRIWHHHSCLKKQMHSERALPSTLQPLKTAPIALCMHRSNTWLTMTDCGAAVPLFQQLSPLTKIGPNKPVETLSQQVGTAPDHYSTHSFQIGDATGLPDCKIWMLGRWLSDSYQVYIQTPPCRASPVSKNTYITL